MPRVALALAVGAAVAVLAAVTVGEYPLSAADIWLAALIVPALIGSIMAAIGRRPRSLWVAAGPLAGGSVGWGIGISTTWGIEPVPADAWFALAAAALWPVVWGLAVFSRSRKPLPSQVERDPVTPNPVTPDPVTPDRVTPDRVTPDPVTPHPVKPGSVDRQLGDASAVRRPEVGDP